MERIYCIVNSKGLNSEPFYLLNTNFENGEDKYVVGVKSNNVLCIVDDHNHLLYDLPAPKELEVYADKVKDFKRNPLWNQKLRRYFKGSSTQPTWTDADI